MGSGPFLRLGSVCAGAYALITVGVNASRALHPDPAAFQEELLDGTVQAREWVLFWGLLILLGTWLALDEHFADTPRRPWARAGLVLTVIFCVVELTHRAVLLVAAPAMARLAAGGGPESVAASAWLAGLDQSVRGLYVVLLSAHGLGSAAFAFAATAPGPERLIRWALGANAIRLALRLLQFPGGLAGLGPINARLYAPVVTLVFAALAVALWQLAGRSRWQAEGTVLAAGGGRG